MMLRQRLAIAAATPNLIPMPTAHAPLDRSTRQIAVRPQFRPLENRRSHSSNPHRSQRRNRAPSGPRFRALALLGRLSWERVDAFVMQASEKLAQAGISVPEKRPFIPLSATMLFFLLFLLGRSRNLHERGGGLRDLRLLLFQLLGFTVTTNLIFRHRNSPLKRLAGCEHSTTAVGGRFSSKSADKIK